MLSISRIQGNAFNQPLNVQVGTGFHSPPFAAPPPGSTGPYGFNTFNIFKDNGRTVYTDPVLGAVTTLYYCVFVSIRINSYFEDDRIIAVCEIQVDID
jgi:hypothetical protein